ncbi:PhzF family phenazine biosynthesis protein [Ferruginibacter albus]|uniref:PhzF family phenazine biosynthesis protein n=1 Tax=Ferruginibacter albus TaxID=2875540 RepID=UPI001CC5AD78|nr:PhzF family phenazine biosynthesis protein [Ferruginibacter albus]UAY51399.1 PhzF family phenazine biosynthesis protein [Ferruginibacter albus]
MTLYQIDAFTNKLFHGNPAAVVPLEQWIDDKLMQQLALENNLAETVFFIPSQNENADFDIRWFTPEIEINLCGHATLASAYVLYELLDFKKDKIVFSSKSGLLTITKNAGKYIMDFPSWKPQPYSSYPLHLSEILGNVKIVNVSKNRDLLVELENEDAVKNCTPDFTALKKTGEKVIITAKGSNADFVSRFFAPSAGINEDPVTGSAHSQLIPYWSAKLNKNKLHAFQLSQRGGELWCEQLNEERVSIGGQCVFYMKGAFEV